MVVMLKNKSESLGGGGWGELMSDGAALEELEGQECRRILHTASSLSPGKVLN